MLWRVLVVLEKAATRGDQPPAAAAREGFEREFKGAAAGSPSSQIIGSATLIEPCEIVAVAEGASGFLESASFS